VNLLITNVQEEQTYVMLRCLRQEAKKVIVTMTGDSWLQRWSGMCTWSRYVSKRYRVPDCAADWKTGGGLIRRGQPSGYSDGRRR
jgi:hypothetical protein